MIKALRNATIAATGIGAMAYAAQRVAAARLRTKPDDDAKRALEAPLYVSHKLASHDQGTINVVEAGSGPTIVLSHGVTLSVRTWFYQLEALAADGFRVLAFDHRGHGESVLGDSGHSIDNLAEDVRSMLVGLDVRDAVLVGHSMGGIAVQAFVTRFPDIARERVRGIVLLSTLAKAPLARAVARYEKPLERAMDRLPDSTALWDAPNFGLVLTRLGFGRHPKPSHVELVRRMMRDCSEDTRRLAPRALVGLDLTDEIASIQIPTLVIGGLADLLTPPSEARRIARLIPGARLELVPGGGHMLMLERTDLINQLIADFAREVQGDVRAGGRDGAAAAR
ncbi:MAG: putative hydrolase or acyltransferase of alpha/beta superfamily [Actinomycetia bacterium]|nr:putative hydrolase or acyltransferase of alpha/beta superfamily [Actinomycetes bacterium]